MSSKEASNGSSKEASNESSKQTKIYLDELRYDVSVDIVKKKGIAHYRIYAPPRHEDDAGYLVTVKPDYSPIQVNNNALNQFGLSRQAGETNNDLLERLVRVSTNADSWDEGTRQRMEKHQTTPLHRVAVVAASARTDFQLQSRVFAADPSFGGAGSGPDFVSGGGNGGSLSKIGIAHDTDWVRGYLTNDGPLWPLGRIRSDMPSGLHGLPSSRAGLRLIGQGDSEPYRQWQRETREVPELRNVASYDTPRGHPDWNINLVIRVSRADELGVAGTAVEGREGYVAISPDALLEKGYTVNEAGKILAIAPGAPQTSIIAADSESGIIASSARSGGRLGDNSPVPTDISVQISTQPAFSPGPADQQPSYGPQLATAQPGQRLDSDSVEYNIAQLTGADRALYQDALRGVREMNETLPKEQKLPEREAALAIAAEADKAGLQNIADMRLGNLMTDGRQNIFFSSSEISDRIGAALPLSIDRTAAASIPALQSLNDLVSNNPSPPTPTAQTNTTNPISTGQEPAPHQISRR
jgi:predicted secreted protein